MRNEDFEKALFNFLYEEGLSLLDGNTGKVIDAGRGDKDWTVTAYDEISGKDYKTLRRAIKEAAK